MTFPGVAVFDGAPSVALKVFDFVAWEAFVWEAFALRSGENDRCSLRQSGDFCVFKSLALLIHDRADRRIGVDRLRTEGTVGPTKENCCFGLEVDVGRFVRY